MPAVNPARLDQQIEELILFSSDPEKFTKECLELFEFYSDRTKRPPRAADLTSGPSMGVSRPVIRRVGLEVNEALREDPALDWEAIARRLWDSEFREPRMIAVGIIGEHAQPVIREMVEAWALDCGDELLFQLLASTGLARVRRDHVAHFFSWVSGWVHSSTNRLRYFGLLCIETALDETKTEHLPEILDTLHGASENARSDTRIALDRIIGKAAKVSPQEVARFLIDEFEGEVTGADRLIRATHEQFPPSQRERLDALLQN